MIFSLLRSSRAVGRSLALSPSFASRLVISRALSVGAASTPTPYVVALASARARFFATTRSVGFADAAEGEKKTTPKKKSSSTGTKKKTTAKTSAAKKKPTRKVAAKKKTVGARKTKPAKRGRVAKAKPKKEERILKKDLRPPFKHPGSAWVNFYREYIVGKQGSGSSVTVLLPEASKLWKEMSDDAKQAYAPTREAIAEYSLKRKEWVKSLPLKRRKIYAADHKKPAIQGLPSVYSQFTKENYATAPGDSFVEKGRALKEKWDNMGDVEKDEFKQRIMRTREEIKANNPPAEA